MMRLKKTLVFGLLAINVLAGLFLISFSRLTHAQRLCENNGNAVATIAPCFGPVGTTITVNPAKRLASAPGQLVFKRVLANGTPSQVITSVSSNSATAPNQLCARGNGKWEVWLVLANGQSQGKIGAFTVSDCAGANSTGLGKRPPASGAPAIEKVILPPITIKVDNEVYVKTKNTSQSYLKDIDSTVPEVATGTEWGTNEVKVRGKTPGTTTISFFDANTGTLYRVQVTVVKKGEDLPPGGGGNIKHSSIDACLVGTWLATTVTTRNSRILGGGDGFRVTFEQNGTETIDYSSAKPLQLRGDTMTYRGTATARITTEKDKATIKQIIKTGVLMSLSAVNEASAMPMPGLAYGGLGDTAGGITYVCTNDSLQYQGSMSAKSTADVTIKLTRQRK